MNNFVPGWMREGMAENARVSLPDKLAQFDITNWGQVIDMAHLVITAAGNEKTVVSFEDTHDLHQIARNVVHFDEELPEGFRPLVQALLKDYGTENASEGEKFVQYAVEEAMANAPQDHWQHLFLFFGDNLPTKS